MQWRNTSNAVQEVSAIRHLRSMLAKSDCCKASDCWPHEQPSSVLNSPRIMAKQCNIMQVRTSPCNSERLPGIAQQHHLQACCRCHDGLATPWTPLAVWMLEPPPPPLLLLFLLPLTPELQALCCPQQQLLVQLPWSCAGWHGACQPQARGQLGCSVAALHCSPVHCWWAVLPGLECWALERSLS